MAARRDDDDLLAAWAELEGHRRGLSARGQLRAPELPARLDVERAERIRVRALDREGKSFETELEGLLAVCVQHEIDHLDGKLFVDYLSDLKRQRVRKKIEKERGLRAEGRAGETSRAPAI